MNCEVLHTSPTEREGSACAPIYLNIWVRSLLHKSPTKRGLVCKRDVAIWVAPKSYTKNHRVDVHWVSFLSIKKTRKRNISAYLCVPPRSNIKWYCKATIKLTATQCSILQHLAWCSSLGGGGRQDVVWESSVERTKITMWSVLDTRYCSGLQCTAVCTALVGTCVAVNCHYCMFPPYHCLGLSWCTGSQIGMCRAVLARLSKSTYENSRCTVFSRIPFVTLHPNPKSIILRHSLDTKHEISYFILICCIWELGHILVQMLYWSIARECFSEGSGPYTRSVLQCVAACCSAWQCVAVCCSA